MKGWDGGGTGTDGLRGEMITGAIQPGLAVVVTVKAGHIGPALRR